MTAVIANITTVAAAAYPYRRYSNAFLYVKSGRYVVEYGGGPGAKQS